MSSRGCVGMWETSSLPLPCLAVSTSKIRRLPLRASKRHVPSLDKPLKKSDDKNLKNPIAEASMKLQGYLESLYDLELKVVEQHCTESLTNGNQPPDDYYVNFGKAIETIKEDFPRLFIRDFDCVPYCSLRI